MSHGNVVTKSNHLIQASYTLTLNEQRVILACISQLDGRKPLPKDNLFSITATEFAELFKVDLKNAYRALQEATDRLYERDIKTYDGRVRTRFRWVQHVEYREGQGTVSLMFSSTIAPYLTMLSKQFTSYAIAHVSGLASPYSIRLFEMLMQHKDSGVSVIRVEDFRAWLELEGQYPRWFDLRRWVIEPAVKELTEKSRLSIEWEPIKKGRSVDRLKFTFHQT